MHTCKSSNVVKFKQSLRPKTLQSGCFQKLRFWITLFCKPKGTKAKLWFAKLCAKLRAKLRFASLTKQSFVWRQNYSPQALASHTKLTKLTKLRVQKQSFCKYKLCTSFVRRLRAKTLFLQVQALYKLCKLY